MDSGKVKFYNTEQGFGYVRPDDGKKDILFHATVLKLAGITGLREGQKVKFETQIDASSGKATVSAMETG